MSCIPFQGAERVRYQCGAEHISNSLLRAPALLPQAPRTTGRFRLYAAKDVARLTFIKQMRGLGFSLQEIKKLLDLREMQKKSRAKREAATVAIVAALSTLACCVPLGFLGAVRLASMSVWAQQFRPWLLAASIALLCVGLVQLYFSGPTCDVAPRAWFLSQPRLWRSS